MVQEEPKNQGWEGLVIEFEQHVSSSPSLVLSYTAFLRLKPPLDNPPLIRPPLIRTFLICIFLLEVPDYAQILPKGTDGPSGLDYILYLIPTVW